MIFPSAEGLFVCTLNGSAFWELCKDSHFVAHPLSLSPGNCERFFIHPPLSCGCLIMYKCTIILIADLTESTFIYHERVEINMLGFLNMIRL